MERTEQEWEAVYDRILNMDTETLQRKYGLQAGRLIMKLSETPTLSECRYAMSMLCEIARDWRETDNWTDRRQRLWDKHTATVDAYMAFIREEAPHDR